MTRIFSVNAISLFLFALGFSSCLKDQCVQQFTYYQPVYKTTAEVRANIRSNPPRELKKPGKIYVLGNYIFLNETDKGIHVIDNTTASSPRPVAFIDIPGNIDMAVKGNMLYADAYTDLVVLDISNPLKVEVKKIVDGVFPYRFYNRYFIQEKDKVIVDWVARDTTMDTNCGSGGIFGIEFMARSVVADLSVRPNSGGSGGSPTGIAGSMARFTLIDQHLYTVSHSSLNVFRIQNPAAPEKINEVALGWDIETIYPFKDRLFIGSMSGMFIFSVAQPDKPQALGTFIHANSCDPVVADDTHAFVTLRSGNSCQGFTNQLDIVGIEDLNRPSLIKSYGMENPHGLAKDGNLLFICDGKAGLKVFDAADVRNLNQLGAVKDIETFDVIARQQVALVSAMDGLYQYDYKNAQDLRFLSKIPVKHE